MRQVQGLPGVSLPGQVDDPPGKGLAHRVAEHARRLVEGENVVILVQDGRTGRLLPLGCELQGVEM